VLAGTPLPPAQVAALQAMPAPYFAQAALAVAQAAGARRSRRPASGTSLRGFGDAGGQGRARARLPGWLQLVHGPLQARLQHTPSAHEPESHSPSFSQTAPSGFLPHILSRHSCPSHWALLEQLAKQRSVTGSQP
jgi:hypothetical protein